MQKLLPVFKQLPLVLFLYGVVRTITELLELKTTVHSLMINANSSVEERTLVLSSVIRAADSFFFYTAMSVLALAAYTYIERNA